MDDFYTFCESVFAPELRGKPLVVLSNNDGCVIARSQEAKALGIRMGQPAHELKGLVRTQELQMRSANFSLYGDMSARVVSILRDAAPRIEVYSIDESFLDLSGIRDALALCMDLRARIRQWTGIATCVGLAPTFTLAKLANKVAKKGAGVVDFSSSHERANALATFPVEDVWGVGRRGAARLGDMGIATAADLRDAPPTKILQQFGVTLARTQRELQGYPCIALQEIEPDRQQIVVSRSFGQREKDHASIHQALATFAVRASEKLRARDLVAAGVSIFASTDPFRPDLRQHHPTRAITLPIPTADTRLVLQAVTALVRGLLRSDCEYKKVGVCLLDLARPADVQSVLFGPATAGNPELMSTLDAVNKKFGKGTVGFAATGWVTRPVWGMRQQMLSPHYTTRISDLPRARC